MIIAKTTWEPLSDAEPEWAGDVLRDREQPGFEMSIKWNVPRRWWQPYIVLRMWTLRLSVGWLY